MANCVVCSNEIRDDARFCPSCGAEQPKQGPEPGSSDDPFIGQVVARNFKIESLLGVGGMGKVYKARQLSLDKVVVIKILHDHFRDDPQLVQRFQREARAASRLNHPNSIQVIDFGQDENQVLYMAIEYLEGRDLFTVLREQGPLPADRIARVMMQVCSALAEAHEHNVIHRDLKPENIMVEDRRGQRDFVKVLDFGIAKIQDNDSAAGQALTQAGMVCGTPEYMSPEQARGMQLDARSDLYALGVVAYQLATGELPFLADSPIGIVTKHILEPPVPPRQKNPAIPEALEAIILKAMAKEADKRFQSAIEMGEAFEALLWAAPAPAVTPAPRPQTGTLVGAPVVQPPSTQPPSTHPPSTQPPAAVVTQPPPAPSSTSVQPAAASATEDSQPAVRTLSAEDIAAPARSAPSLTSPTPTGIAGSANDDLDRVPSSGGALKWAALVGVLVLALGGGAVFALKDTLFGGGERVTVNDPVGAKGSDPTTTEPTEPKGADPANATATDPTPKEPTSKDPEPKEPKAKDPTPKDPTPKDPSPRDPTPKDPEPKDPVTASKDPKERDDKGDRVARPGKGDRRKVSPVNKKRARELHAKANALAISKRAADRKKAYEMLKEALDLDPSNPDPLQAISFIHQRNGDFEKSCGAMRAFIVRKKLGRSRGEPLLKAACKQ